MKEKFESLTEEKQRKIVNASYKIFSTYGYKKASTNEIIVEAGISKGLLFHYFKSKKGLYTYIYQLSIDLLSSELYLQIDPAEPDVLKRLHTIIMSKIILVQKYPELFDFLKSAYFEEAADIKQIVQSLNNEIINKSYEILYSNIDLTLFRQDIDWKMAVQTIYATLEKWSDTYIQQFKDKTFTITDDRSITCELERYISFFQRSFYKTTT